MGKSFNTRMEVENTASAYEALARDAEYRIRRARTSQEAKTLRRDAAHYWHKAQQVALEAA